MTAVLEVGAKREGRVYTPDALANALCEWAICGSNDAVLDLGVGEGAFLLAAARRLKALGADEAQIREAVHGSELDPTIFARAVQYVHREIGYTLPHVQCADFYDAPLASFDAIVGNPPYIRRHYQGDPGKTRAAARGLAADGMTDAYCFFLLRACAALRRGGRMAVVVSASWLDMRYGETLKRTLLGHDFSIRLVLGFEGRVFSDALVKPVVLLVERVASSHPIRFGRLGQQVDFSALARLTEDVLGEATAASGVAIRDMEKSELDPRAPWSGFLKEPGVYSELLSTGEWVPLKQLAESRIGLQAFGKAFYLLTRQEAQRRHIEPTYLLPLAFSPRDAYEPVLLDASETSHVVFACNEPLENLTGTGAERHIRWGMEAVVPIRGTERTVRGFAEAPRLKRAGRDPWYDVRTEIDRRGTWPILLPRRAFRSYLVVHNRASVVANEDFLELRPREAQWTAPLLAILNTSMGELLVRSHGFQYGGGVFNVNPGPLRDVPLPNLAALAPEQRAELTRAWHLFAGARGSGSARESLDRNVAAVLGLPLSVQREVAVALGGLVRSVHETRVPHGVRQLRFAAEA